MVVDNLSLKICISRDIDLVFIINNIINNLLILQITLHDT